jgi:hypothetical protein
MNVRWLGLLWIPALACGEGGVFGGGELPSPYAEDGDADGDTPAMSADAVIDAAFSGLETFMQLEPDAIVDAYEALAVPDAECPEEYEAYSQGGVEAIIWSTPGCTTAAGVEFQGSARFERVTTNEGGYTGEGATLSAEGGAFRVTAPGGEFLQYAGYLYYDRSTDGESTNSYFDFSGTAEADPQTAAASPALADGVTVSGGFYTYAGPGYKGMGGSGFLAGPSLGDARAFQFSDFVINSNECPEEPIGTVSVRDDEGYWYDVVFDIATYDPEIGDDPIWEPANCDGCGAFMAGGAPSGEACVEAGRVPGLLDWQDYPW